MANDAVIGALSVIIGGDASALDKVLKGASNGLAGFAKSVAGIASGIGLEKAISGAISSVTGMIEKGLADADALAKMAQSTGVSVEQLSKLKYAADLSSVSSDTLSKSLQSLSVGLSDLASGKVTPAALALQAMGISARNADGSLKTSGQTLAEIADKFASYKDGAAKAALAQGAFGAGGEALIPMLNKGRVGLSEMGEEAQKFGRVLSDEAQFAVESLNLNLKKMDEIKQGVVLTITSKMLPAFEQISAAMLNLKENSTAVNTVADALTTALKGAVSIALQGAAIFQRLSAEIGAFWNVLKGFSPEHGFKTISDAWAAMNAEGEKTVEVFKGLKTAQDEIFADPNTGGWDQQAFGVKRMSAEVAKLGLTWTQIAAPIAAATDATRNALVMFLDKETKHTAAMEAEAKTVGLSTDAQAKARIEYEAGAIVKTRLIDLDDKLRKSIADTGNAAAAAAQKLAGANLVQDNLAPWELRNQKLAQYNALLAANPSLLNTISLASQKLQWPNFTAAKNSALDLQMQLDQLATNSLNGLASTLAQVVTGAKSAGEAFSAFALQIVTQLAEMIIKAVLFKIIMTAIGFAGGGPVSPEALAVGSGTAPAMAGGGGPVMGAGSGTSDSIWARLSNGEFVVNAADTANNLPLLQAINNGNIPRFAGGGMVGERVSVGTSVPQVMQGQGGPQVLEVRLPQRARFSYAEAVDMMGQIVRAMGNNYKLTPA